LRHFFAVALLDSRRRRRPNTWSWSPRRPWSPDSSSWRSDSSTRLARRFPVVADRRRLHGRIGVIIITHNSLGSSAFPRAVSPSSRASNDQPPVRPREHVVGRPRAWHLVVMVVGEKINAKLPWALAAVLAATILSAVGSLANHGVQQLAP